MFLPLRAESRVRTTPGHDVRGLLGPPAALATLGTRSSFLLPVERLVLLEDAPALLRPIPHNPPLRRLLGISHAQDVHDASQHLQVENKSTNETLETRRPPTPESPHTFLRTVFPTWPCAWASCRGGRA